MAMAANGVVSQHWIDGFDALPSHDDEVHVLAVDDSIVDRKVIEHLLKISSCKVTAVDSGIRALQFLGLDEECSSVGLKVDLIITDYCMPGMTGYELLKKIKESSALKEIPVVIMSSENIMARIDRCLEEGAEDFIVKPVKLSDVKRIKGFMSAREIKSRNEKGNNVNKRKSRDTCSEISSSPPSMSSSLSSSPLSLSNPSSPSRSPSLSPAASTLSLSAPCSPTRTLDSSTRRAKMNDSDQDL